MAGTAATHNGQVHGRIVTKLKFEFAMRVFVIPDFIMRALVCQWVLSMEFRCLSVSFCLLFQEENIAGYIYKCRIYQSTKENLSFNSDADTNLSASQQLAFIFRYLVGYDLWDNGDRAL